METLAAPRPVVTLKSRLKPGSGSATRGGPFCATSYPAPCGPDLWHRRQDRLARRPDTSPPCRSSSAMIKAPRLPATRCQVRRRSGALFRSIAILCICAGDRSEALSACRSPSNRSSTPQGLLRRGTPMRINLPHLTGRLTRKRCPVEPLIAPPLSSPDPLSGFCEPAQRPSRGKLRPSASQVGLG